MYKNFFKLFLIWSIGIYNIINYCIVEYNKIFINIGKFVFFIFIFNLYIVKKWFILIDGEEF